MKKQNVPGTTIPLLEDFEDFFENALCGYANADAEGKIVRVNLRLAGWVGENITEFEGKRLSELLTIGGKIYYETHLWPLLRMQRFFDEVAVELLCKNGEKLQVLLNAYEHHDADGAIQFIRFTFFKATDRKIYEDNLRMAKRIAETNLEQEQNNALLREQFIAVLGHDLRNPLSSIIGASAILARSVTNPLDNRLVEMMQKSATRMVEMVSSVMDFARSRLGGGLNINLKYTELEPVLIHVIDELKIAWPKRTVESNIDIIAPVFCDAWRISQLFSNLLANAITHGSVAHPVTVKATLKENVFELIVKNGGKSIPAAAMEKLFKPFTREETHPSQNGLGLGLYIASEIALAHNGTLAVTSDEAETCFIFNMINGNGSP